MSANAICPYPAYKSSGVEWLGDVPAHWELRRIKTLLQESDERKGQNQIELMSLTRTKGLIPQSENSTQTLLAEDLSRYKICRPTDIVMNRMQAWSGMFAVPIQEGLVSPDYCVFGPVVSCEVRYFEHLFKLPEMVGQFAQRSKGVGSGFNRLYTDDFGSIRTLAPPVSEQVAIVRYLDYVDRRIRRYISAKRKLIALLEEEKQAIVTRGLDPNVRLKPSGVEWLGEVPEHWEVRGLKTVADMRVSNVDKHTREDEIYIRLCNYVDVYKNEKIAQSMSFMNATASWDEIERFRLERDDVLITKDSEAWDDIGVPALVTESADDLLLGYHLALLRPFEAIIGPYLARTFQSKAVAYQFHVRANGVTRYGLTHLGIQSVRIPLPPLTEQFAIVEYLDQATADVDAAITRARRQIELVEEYHTRLIADVVTGKMDVREAVGGLPEDADS